MITFPTPSKNLSLSRLHALIDPSKVPEHVAIAMDGNRRWAKKRNLPAIAGHIKGAESLSQVVRAAAEIGVKVLTVYSFSTENRNRSRTEINALMSLIQLYLEKEKGRMLREGVKLNAIGDISQLPEEVREVLWETMRATSQGNKIELVLALNYGSRDEIRRAALSIVDDVMEGKIKKEELSIEVFSSYLDTARWKDPDLFIRTGGAMRISNFLLWQLSYAEFVMTNTFWPDFHEQEFLEAIMEYQKRERRWGG
jgi:undecaprenyl diphosphate synthase